MSNGSYSINKEYNLIKTIIDAINITGANIREACEVRVDDTDCVTHVELMPVNIVIKQSIIFNQQNT